jgi:flagellar operon protein
MFEPLRIPPNPAVQTGAPTGSSAAKSPANGVSFADFLAQTQTQAQPIRFSNHAQKRLEVRNIALSDEGLSRLAKAVEKADQRGGRESLVMVDDLAFIVNVKQRLVVTAIDAQSRGDGVFTQIDSVVFADPGKSDPIKKA